MFFSLKSCGFIYFKLFTIYLVFIFIYCVVASFDYPLSSTKFIEKAVFSFTLLQCVIHEVTKYGSVSGLLIVFVCMHANVALS